MADKYDFRYVPLSGALPGKDFEQQTEQAINEIGSLALKSSEDAQSAIDTANSADSTAEGALALANEAKAESANVAASLDAVNRDIGIINNQISTVNTTINTLQTNVATIDTIARDAENQSNDNKTQIVAINTTLANVSNTLATTTTTADQALSTAQANLTTLKNLQEYTEVSDVIDLDEQVTLSRLLIKNTSSLNLPTTNQGLLDVDIANIEEEDHDVFLVQKFLSLTDLNIFYRQGYITYVEDSDDVVIWDEWKQPQSNGSSGDSGNPIGSFLKTLAQNPPEGYIRALGGEHGRDTYADLWQWAQDNNLVKSEAEYQAFKAANNSCPFYSEGATEGMFRVPYIIDIFRPIDSVSGDRTVGDVQGDAIRNFTGEVRSGLATTTGNSGATGVYADSYAPGSAIHAYESGSSRVLFARLDPSLVVPTADENRMRNIGVNCYIKAYGAVTNVGDVELEEIKNDVDLQATQIAALQAHALVETWRSSDGLSGYRLYSDNYIEQWGYFVNTTVGTIYTINFPVEFADTNYILNRYPGAVSADTGGAITFNTGHTARTKSSFSTRMENPSKVADNFWEAKGYIGGN